MGLSVVGLTICPQGPPFSLMPFVCIVDHAAVYVIGLSIEFKMCEPSFFIEGRMSEASGGMLSSQQP